MGKKISIVLPTYNGEKYIKKSIESVIYQTYQNWELIIVNDCSKDNTLEIITNYAEIEPRIKVISNEINKKLPASLNVGFSAATGDFFTWTSDDNVYHIDALEKMVNIMEQDHNIDMVYADFNVVDLEGNLLRHVYTKSPDELRFENVIGACFLYQRSLAEKIGHYDTTLFLAEDYEYWIRAYLNGKIRHVSETLYDYGWHDKSLTATRMVEINKATYKAKKKHENDLLAKCISQEEKNKYFWTMLSHLGQNDERDKQRKEYYSYDQAFKMADLKKRACDFVFGKLQRLRNLAKKL